MEDFKDTLLNREIHFISSSRKSCEKNLLFRYQKLPGRGNSLMIIIRIIK